MAQKVQVLLVDDLDGTTADQTVTFALDGVSYEIDLTSENAAKLRDALAVWVGHARKVSRPAARAAAASSPARRRAGRGDAQDVRDWAKAHGHNVSERGRISAKVREAYDAAH